MVRSSLDCGATGVCLSRAGAKAITYPHGNPAHNRKRCSGASDAAACRPGERMADQWGRQARESRISVGKASLYAREIGGGPPIIVLHGGPDFDSGYFLPDLDRSAYAYRLIYYDQRGPRPVG